MTYRARDEKRRKKEEGRKKEEVIIGDPPPSALQKFYWSLAGKCPKCGGVFASVLVRGRHRKLHATRECNCCGYSQLKRKTPFGSK